MPQSPAKSSRRGFLWGAAAVTGAAATVAATLPKGQPEAAPPDTPQAPAAPERGGGYHLSEHVQRYYKSTRT